MPKNSRNQSVNPQTFWQSESEEEKNEIAKKLVAALNHAMAAEAAKPKNTTAEQNQINQPTQTNQSALLEIQRLQDFVIQTNNTLENLRTVIRDLQALMSTPENEEAAATSLTGSNHSCGY